MKRACEFVTGPWRGVRVSDGLPLQPRPESWLPGPCGYGPVAHRDQRHSGESTWTLTARSPFLDGTYRWDSIPGEFASASAFRSIGVDSLNELVARVFDDNVDRCWPRRRGKLS